MSRDVKERKSKTMREVQVIQLDFVRDGSERAESRTNEVKNLIIQMIELSHKRGRPMKDEKEVPHAA